MCSVVALLGCWHQVSLFLELTEKFVENGNIII